MGVFFFSLVFFVSLPQVKNRAGRDTSVTMPQSDFERSWKWLCRWYYKRRPFRWNSRNNLWATALRNKWCVAGTSPWCQSRTLTTPLSVLWGFITFFFSGFWLTDPVGSCLKKNELNFRGDRMFLITRKTSLLFSRRTNRRRTNEDHLQEEEGALA